MHHWLTVFDVLVSIYADQRAHFSGVCFCTMCRYMGVWHAKTIAYHSRSNRDRRGGGPGHDYPTWRSHVQCHAMCLVSARLNFTQSLVGARQHFTSQPNCWVSSVQMLVGRAHFSAQWLAGVASFSGSVVKQSEQIF